MKISEYNQIRHRLFRAIEIIQEIVIERDGYECQNCHRNDSLGNSLSAHHKRPREEGGTDDLFNLTTLCRKCHDAAELGDTTELTSERIRAFIERSQDLDITLISDLLLIMEYNPYDETDMVRNNLQDDY